jgi:hypothetical protein
VAKRNPTTPTHQCVMPDALHHSLRTNSGNLAILATILLASSFVSNFAADHLPKCFRRLAAISPVDGLAISASTL